MFFREYTEAEDWEIFYRFEGWQPAYPHVDTEMEDREAASEKWDREAEEMNAKWKELSEWQFSGGPERIEQYRRERD